MPESTGKGIKRIEPAVTSHPERLAGIFANSEGGVIAQGMGLSREPGCRVAHRIVTENTSPRGGGPENSVLRLDAIIDQILTLAERAIQDTTHRCEPHPIVPGKPFARTEPEETLAIHQYAVDVGAWKTLCRCNPLEPDLSKLGSGGS